MEMEMVLACEKEITPKIILHLWLMMLTRLLVNVPGCEAKVYKINLDILKAITLVTIDGQFLLISEQNIIELQIVINKSCVMDLLQNI